MSTTATATTYDRHVAVFAFPFGSHGGPLLTIIKRLATSSPQTKFSFFSSTKSNHKNFFQTKHDQAQIPNNIKPYNVNDGIPENYTFSGNPLEPIGLFLKETPNNFRERLGEAESNAGMKITCLITDAFFGEFAKEFGVPWVAFWTAGAYSMLMHICTDFIRTNLGLNGEEKNLDQTLDFLPGMSAVQANHDLPLEVIGNLNEPFARLVHTMGLEVPRATAIVLNSFEEIDPIVTKELKSKVQKLLNVGFFTLASPPPSFTDDFGCLSWLDKHEKASVAYLSFGSMLTPAPSELEALVEALEAKRVPFIWSIRDTPLGNPLQEQEGLMEKIGKLGKQVSWAPQLQLLCHSSVGVFITHCGWNSVAECIAGGVPMICRPYFGDQKLNRRFVEDVWKIGVGVEGDMLTKRGMMDALDVVFCKAKGEKLRDNIRVLKEKAIKAVGSTGSSTQNFETLLEIVTASKGT